MGYRSISLIIGMFVVAGCSAEAPDSEVTDTGEQGLAAGATVDIKMMIEEVDQGPTLFGVNPSAYETRLVTFFDTSDLALHAKGVILHSTDEDVVASVQPLKEANVARGYVGNVACEYEKTVGTRAVAGCSLAKATDSFRAGRVLHGVDAPSALFSSAQIGFVEAHATVPDWTKIKALGPVHAQHWKVQTAAIPSQDITLERWNVPGGNRSLEITVRVAGSKAAEAETALRNWVRALGLHAVEGSNQTDAALTTLAN